MATRPVTGGAGFLGSHPCGELLRGGRPPPCLGGGGGESLGSPLRDGRLGRGPRVIGVDTLETGSRTNTEHIRVPGFVHLTAATIPPYFGAEPIDFVYHLASPASPIDYLR